MKKTLHCMLAVGLLLISLTACTESKDKPQSDMNNTVVESPSYSESSSTSEVKKEDCSSVYAEVISVNGNHLTVSIGDQLLSLSVRTEILIDWGEGDQVILYYTGDFDEGIEVHYIDKWTENSETKRPQNENSSQNGDSFQNEEEPGKERKNDSVVAGS